MKLYRGKCTYLEFFCSFLAVTSDYKKNTFQGNNEVHDSIKELTQHLIQCSFALSLSAGLVVQIPSPLSCSQQLVYCHCHHLSICFALWCQRFVYVQKSLVIVFKRVVICCTHPLPWGQEVFFIFLKYFDHCKIQSKFCVGKEDWDLLIKFRRAVMKLCFFLFFPFGFMLLLLKV